MFMHVPSMHVYTGETEEMPEVVEVVEAAEVVKLTKVRQLAKALAKLSVTSGSQLRLLAGCSNFSSKLSENDIQILSWDSTRNEEIRTGVKYYMRRWG